MKCILRSFYHIHASLLGGFSHNDDTVSAKHITFDPSNSSKNLEISRDEYLCKALHVQCTEEREQETTTDKVSTLIGVIMYHV